MVYLSYILDGTGWATATIGLGDCQVAMTTSYLHDSLANLAQAAVDLRNCSAGESVLFMDEPGEHLVVLRRDEDRLFIEVRWFDDWASWDLQPKDRYKTVLEGVCLISEFTNAVRRALDEFLSTWGIEGYQQKWVEHPFPAATHAALTAGE